MRFRPLDRRFCAAQLGWPDDRFHVLFPSFPEHPRKGYELAQRAVERLRSEGVPVILHCLDRVAHADVPMWLSAADCVILTSTHEGSPNIVKEALGCGQAVVSVDVGDVRERLLGIPGCEVSGPDPESLAAALGRTRMVARIEANRPIRRRRVEGLSLQNAAAKVVAVYDSVLRRSSARARSASVKGGVEGAA
jgi:glycosyltransferase involved in cell wall biosynthesis